MDRREAIEILVTRITNKVNELHTDRKTWNKICGQWLVYRFEQSIGFGNAVELEAKVEQAYRTKQPIDIAVRLFLETLYKIKAA